VAAEGKAIVRRHRGHGGNLISRDELADRSIGMSSYADLTLRLSTEDDALALGRLAQLDDTLYDGSSVLVAQVGQELVAALPLDGGAAFADPFRPSAELVELLRLRRAQIAAAESAGRGVSGARRAVRRLRRYRAPASA